MSVAPIAAPRLGSNLAGPPRGVERLRCAGARAGAGAGTRAAEIGRLRKGFVATESDLRGIDAGTPARRVGLTGVAGPPDRKGAGPVLGGAARLVESGLMCEAGGAGAAAPCASVECAARTSALAHI
jgi:hypothetical protein